jgi:hypothetical protein
MIAQTFTFIREDQSRGIFLIYFHSIMLMRRRRPHDGSIPEGAFQYCCVDWANTLHNKDREESGSGESKLGSYFIEIKAGYLPGCVCFRRLIAGKNARTRELAIP